MNIEIKENLLDIFGSKKISFDVLLKDYTSFKLGGPADIFFRPNDNEDLRNMINFCRERELEYFVLGRGSNVLVGDKGFRGIVISLGENFSSYEVDGNTVKAQAGIALSKLADIILDASLTGFEFASGIPGSLGGAVYMNAGAYGGEIKDVLVNATVLTKAGEILELSNADLDFGYRKTKVMEMGAIVLEASFSFEKADRTEIQAKMEDLNSRRREKQPLEFPSAGSTFKRPEGYYAGKLIMDSGLAGYRVGGASVSAKHCGFVINDRGATSAEVVRLIDDIKARVFENFEVEMECEVRFVGEF